MTGRVIPLQGDWHGEFKKLLPWYATGALSAEERADIAAHLANCAECQGELQAEQRMAEIIVTAPSGHTGDVDAAWAVARKRMSATPRGVKIALASALAAAGVSLGARWREAGPALRGVVLAQAAGLVLAAGALTWQAQTAPRYHALSAPAAAAGDTANLIVKFRPATTEAQMRALLRESEARVVGGPTAADAYLLRAPETGRNLALAQLRASADVLLAEPIDGSAP
jgi:hypothetical protein